MTTHVLEFADVHYTYPGARQPALNGVTLAVPAGRRCALLGRNGCGKSTLFLHANGIFRPQKGQVLWKGVPISARRAELQALKRNVGLVFQDPEQQLIAATVAEDLSYGLCNLHLPEEEIKEKVRRTLEAFGMSEWADTPVHHLSLGQKRRVALAGVMVMEPELLLLDEPTSYLDPWQTEAFVRELERIHAAGTTIVMATHDLDFAFAWADWVFVMDAGRLVLAGEPERVFARRDILADLRMKPPAVLELWEAIPGHVKERLRRGLPRTPGELAERLRSL
ncbi:energy-coupling factor ABC transporter ATP-binding protein [Brevibacillus thermoruber]|uniref:energy-coupling factor ABC transporter ATP-binding protein n=1 Tax=Brevibacillus thermoruber TaxID=33942 RepID=UPI000420C4F1|nr:ABC transporter ATP-binding protein [Brevibacillus thermoruber]